MLIAVLWLCDDSGLLSSQEFRDLEAMKAAWDDRIPSVSNGCIDILFGEYEVPNGLRMHLQGPPALYVTLRAAHVLARHCTLVELESLPNDDGITHVLRSWDKPAKRPVLSTVSIEQVPTYASRQLVDHAWVDQFKAEHSEDANQLEAVGITDEASYLLYDHLLPHPLRVRIGRFRFTAFETPAASYDVLRHIAPKWLLDQRIDKSILSERIKNVFNYYAIDEWADALSRSEEHLRRLKNFGAKSVSDLSMLLRQIARGEKPHYQPFAVNEKSQNSTDPGHLDLDTLQLDLPTYNCFRDAFEEALATSLFPREQTILREACGFMTNKQALQEIGDRSGLSRERIRQLLEQSSARLRRNHVFKMSVFDRLVMHVQSSDDPLSLQQLFSVDPWFDDSLSIDVTEFLCDRVFTRAIQVTGRGEGCVLIPWHEEPLQRVSRNVVECLQKMASARTPMSSLEQTLMAMMPDVPKSILRYILSNRAYAMQTALDASDGSTYLVAYGSKLDNIIHAVLESSAEPMTVEQIHSELLQMGYDYAVNSVAGRSPYVGIHFGARTYGLKRHLHVSANEIGTLVENVATVLFSDLDRQWHLSEVKVFLRGIYDISALGLNDYTIMNLLCEDDRIETLGYLSLRYRAKEHDEDVSRRLKIVETMEAILEEYGLPMPASELRAELKDRRGTPEDQQLFYKGRVIRLRKGLVGLMDRDVKLTDQEHAGLVDALIQANEQMGISPYSPEAIAIARTMLSEYDEVLDDQGIKSLIQKSYERVYPGR